jgi:hypothetical protein
VPLTLRLHTGAVKATNSGWFAAALPSSEPRMNHVPHPYPCDHGYPKVERAHVVPRCWLRQFAEDELIGMRLVGEAESKLILIDDAAIRKRFYRRTRPDGTSI